MSHEMPTRKGGSKPRTTPRARDASPATEEEVYAHYIGVTQSYTRTSEHFGMPLSTVFGMVKRVGGDRLEEHRRAMRADLATKIWKRVTRLAGVVTPKSVGIAGRSSRGAEAARAAADLSRVMAVLEPKETTADDGRALAINVFTGLAPASEDEVEVQAQPGPDGKVTLQ